MTPQRAEGSPPGTAALPLALLRALVERQLEASSLRQAAREIGLSPNALRNFLRGAVPRMRTRVRIERWVATRAGSPTGPEPAAFARLLSELAPDLPASEANRLGREVSRLLLNAYRRRQMPPPRWVRELVRHYRADSPRGP